MANRSDLIDIDSDPKALNVAILVAMGSSFMLDAVFCLFLREKVHRELMGIFSSLGLVGMFSYGAYLRTKRIFATIGRIKQVPPAASNPH